MKPARIINIAGLSAAVDQQGGTITSSQAVKASAVVTTTGTSTGAVTIWVSNDPPGVPDSSGILQPTNWVVTSQTVAVTAAGSVLIPAFDMCYAWMKSVFTHTNGAAGTVTVNIEMITF
jgi:hypothetical protein